MEGQTESDKRQLKLLVISTFPPKQCGIGTFSQSLVDGIVAGDGETDYRVVAINDPADRLTYGWAVRQQIEKEELPSLFKAADYCNACGADAISIQHEFGIWGGFDGELILPFLDRLRVPVIVTFHSVPLTRSSFGRDNRIRLLGEIARRVRHVVTFVPEARDFLIARCGVRPDRVTVLWHGAPVFPTGREVEARAALALSDCLVVSTFGLLTRFKGLDYALRALPPLVARYPHLCYLLLGQPHPAEPPAFISELQSLVTELGIEEHVRFVPHYLSDREIADYLAATDVYLTPYLDETQISSGTLTFALSAGKCCVSTRYVYARNALAERGLLVPFADSAAITEALDQVLGNPALRATYAERAREFGRQLGWPTVARQFADLVRAVLAADALDAGGPVVDAAVLLG